MSPKTILLVNKSSFDKELRDAGFDVFTIGLDIEQGSSRLDQWSQEGISATYREGESIEEILERLKPKIRPDYIFYHDDSSVYIRLRGLERCSVPTCFYSVDAHIHHGWHSFFGGMFDAVFVAQKNHLNEYLEVNPQSHWLPLWAPFIHLPDSEKRIECCFRGNLDPVARKKRIEFLEAVAAQVPLDYGTGHYKEPFCSSKIVLNEQIAGDINFRVFEALSCGALLITPKCENGFDELFKDGEHLVTYPEGDSESAARLIRYYLDHENDRERIAAAGYAHIKSHHTAKNRVDKVVEILNSLKISRPCPFSAALYSELFMWTKNNPVSTLNRSSLPLFIELIGKAISRNEPPSYQLALSVTEIAVTLNQEADLREKLTEHFISVLNSASGVYGPSNPIFALLPYLFEKTDEELHQLAQNAARQLYLAAPFRNFFGTSE